MKDGTTHLAYKPEHTIPTPAPWSRRRFARQTIGDTTTLSDPLKAAAANVAKVDRAPSTPETTEPVADKGTTPVRCRRSRRRRPEERIAEPQHTAFLRWRGDTEARNAVYANRNRLHSVVGKQSMSATGGDRRAIVRS